MKPGSTDAPFVWTKPLSVAPEVVVVAASAVAEAAVAAINAEGVTTLAVEVATVVTVEAVDMEEDKVVVVATAVVKVATAEVVVRFPVLSSGRGVILANISFRLPRWTTRWWRLQRR
jgi:hypothetical protein